MDRLNIGIVIPAFNEEKTIVSVINEVIPFGTKPLSAATPILFLKNFNIFFLSYLLSYFKFNNIF